MAQLKIYWTETAIKQRDYILEYWLERNGTPAYSKKLYKKVIERIKVLKKQPDIGKPTEFKNTKLISLGHYSILYQIHKPKIIITGFWDNRQDPNKLLNFLKSRIDE